MNPLKPPELETLKPHKAAETRGQAKDRHGVAAETLNPKP